MRVWPLSSRVRFFYDEKQRFVLLMIGGLVVDVMPLDEFRREFGPVAALEVVGL